MGKTEAFARVALWALTIVLFKPVEDVLEVPIVMALCTTNAQASDWLQAQSALEQFALRVEWLL